VLATTESVSSAALLSIAVTSTSMFFVFLETIVLTELVIGGNEIVFPSESKIIGTCVEFPKIAPYCFPTSVFSKILEIESSRDSSNGTNL